MTDQDSLTRVPDQLTKVAYPFEFRMEPSGLYCARLKLRLAPDEFDIVDAWYSDQSASGDGEQVLFFISSLPGVMGTLVLATRDIYSENMTFEMAVKLRTHPYGEWICS